MRPSEEIFCKHSKKLLGKTIVVGITGSIAAVDSFHFIRELVRNGAKVIPVMTQNAVKLVTPDAIEFAQGTKPIVEIGGECEHIQYFGNSLDADLLIIYPCSADTISKIASGIADTTVTTMASVALGNKIPIGIAPAMHEAMMNNPAVKKNLETLEKFRITIIPPHCDDGRCRIASVGESVAWSIRLLSKDDLKGKKILVIGGRSEEPLDSMRLITNRSSGMMSVVLATDAFVRGADVTLWMGACNVNLPDFATLERFESVSSLQKLVDKQEKYDVIIVPAALADFTPKNVATGKIPSENKFTVELEPVPKILPLLKKKTTVLIGFKAESGLSHDELIKRARSRLDEYSLNAIIANDIDSAGKISTNAIIVTKDNAIDITGTKLLISESILNFISELF